jgi:hypothetical protein
MIMISLKMPTGMKNALQKLAQKQGVPMTGLIRQLVDRYLDEHGIDWQEEESEK